MQVTLLVFILAAAAFLSAITAMRIAIRGRIVDMPNITGKSLTEAARLAGGQKVHLRVADRLYDATPANTVIRQSPAPGQEIKVQQDAEVVLSLGPQQITIPLLEGQPQRLARITLLQSGLQLGEVSVAYLPPSEASPGASSGASGVASSGTSGGTSSGTSSGTSGDADTVVQQYPPAGSKAASPRVDLLVSAGPPPVAYIMPSVIGLQAQDADRILAAAGFHNVKHSEISQASAASGAVIGQTPPPGGKIDADANVELGVAATSQP